MKKWIILLLVVILSIGSLQSVFACTPGEKTYHPHCPTIPWWPPIPTFGPVAKNDSYCVNSGEELKVPAFWGVLQNDINIPRTGAVVTINVSAYDFNGTFSYQSDGSFTYRSDDEGYSGVIKFDYTVTVGNKSSTATVTITVKPILSTETAWAYGEDKAKPLSDYVSSNNWGWTNGPLSKGYYTFDLYAGAGNNNLSNGTRVGKLYIYITNSFFNKKVKVRYEMFDGFTMEKADLYVGNNLLPKDKNSNYINRPGQFPYIKEFYNPVSSYEFGEYKFNKNDKIYIAAHADVRGRF